MTDWKNIRGAGSYRQINATHCELRYRKDGKQLIRRIPCTVEEAKNFLATEYIGRGKRKAGMVGGSWDQAWEAYSERQKARGKSDGYLVAVYTVIERLKAYCQGDSLQLMDADRIEGFLTRRAVQASTKNKMRAMLRSFFHFCCRKRFVSANPVDGVEFFDVVKKEPRRLEPWEFRKIRKSAESGDFDEVLDWILLTGCRVSEMIGAVWSDFSGSRWEIGKRKRGVNVTVPLNDRLIEILHDRQEYYTSTLDKTASVDGPFTMYTKKRILTKIKLLCALTGVKPFKTHDLRHAAASWAIEGGATHEQVKHLLGHTSSKTTEIYSNPDPVDTARAVQGLIEKKLKGE